MTLEELGRVGVELKVFELTRYFAEELAHGLERILVQARADAVFHAVLEIVLVFRSALLLLRSDRA